MCGKFSKSDKINYFSIDFYFYFYLFIILFYRTSEETSLTLKIPETITTWRITAFTINAESGLGVAKEAAEITTFQKFFISLNLPYCVKRGELIQIPVVLFNYYNQSLDTEVSLINNEQEYDFAGTSVDNEGIQTNKQNQTKMIQVPANGAKNVPFLINPKKIGYIDLLVIANNSLSSDGVNQTLKVEPEGVIKHQNQATVLNLADEESNVSLDFTPNIPEDTVPNSEFFTLAVGGDMLLPTLENLNNLVRLPKGSGEQNLVTFASNTLVLDYLKANREFAKHAELINKAKMYMEVGYQQQLSFRHDNGGFSVFGKQPKYDKTNQASVLPSIWLTAYAIRFFIKASAYISIEDKIIESGLDFLSTAQLENGEFIATGYVFEPEHHNRYGLTAHVLQAFLENPVSKKGGKGYNVD